MRWRQVYLSLVLVAGASAVLVHTPTGLKLEGSQLLTPAGNDYFAFTSIPYAKPPVGKLRLKNPVLLEDSSKKIDATKPAPKCIQTPIFLPALRKLTFGQEDCLYLNVYTRSTDPSAKLPVMVYVHGGGFRCGQPPEAPEAPTNFMNYDAVLVTVHYRLGTLGFLSTEDSKIPGNFGLKDQAMAIKWVKRNIEGFGGDPDSITVFGESAGGVSSHYLITSPLSRDLLKGGIAQSGVTDSYWAFSPPGRARKTAQKLAEVVGCDINNKFLECLRKVDAAELTLAETKLLIWDFDPAVIFQPVIEVENDGAFLTEDPRKIKVTKPLITGIVPGEGVLKTISLLNQDDSALDEFTNNFDELLPRIFFVELDNPRASEFVAVVKARYFKDLSNREETIKGLDRLYYDILFSYPMYLTLRRHSGPKYVYFFDHRAENSICSKLGAQKNLDPRACHGDELLSLFNWTSSFPGTKGRDEDHFVSKELVKMWLHFGKHQKPVPSGSEVKWDEFRNGKNYLHIKTDKFEFIKEPFPHNTAEEFWNYAFKIIEPPALLKEEL